MPAARLIATCVALPRWRSPGFTRNPKKVMAGSTTQPVSRSSTTDAKLVGPSPESRDRRLTRSTSPPIVVGSTLATNWPAM